jgi:hypothetical protein
MIASMNVGGSSYAEIASTLGKVLDTGFTTKPCWMVVDLVVGLQLSTSLPMDTSCAVLF